MRRIKIWKWFLGCAKFLSNVWAVLYGGFDLHCDGWF